MFLTTHTKLRAALLATGDQPIVEKTLNDYFWGCGETGNGQNMLGKILMETRDELRGGACRESHEA